MDGWWTPASPVELKWSVKQLEIYSSSPITHYIFTHTSRMKLLPVHFDVTTLIILIAIINVNIFILFVKIRFLLYNCLEFKHCPSLIKLTHTAHIIVM